MTSASAPRPAAAIDAQQERVADSAQAHLDVTEGRSEPAERYVLTPHRDREGRGLAAQVAIWFFAGAISLFANAELIMLLVHRDSGETIAGQVDPNVVLIDLPAVDTAPAEPTPPDASSATSLDASHDAPLAETASREPEGSEPPDAEPAPVTAPPVTALPLTQAPEPWSAAPLPVPRPHSRHRSARRAVDPPSTRRVVKAAATRPAHVAEVQREMRAAAASAFAGASSAADWRSLVVAAINRAKHYPDGTEAVGSPTIRMTVAASGDVARVAIVASSGSSVLDSAAVETVRRTSPLPPPPGGATGITFRMNFHLRSQ